MSFNLFQLVPSVYKLRDAEIARSMQLLTPAEQTTLATLQAQTTPLSVEQQAQMNELTAKAIRGPLESLLAVISEQLAALAEDLDQLYDDQFIETCAPWVIPYIGDLIGYQSIQGISSAVDNPRAEVANTISYRRRKGTSLVLEQLARDVTGWGAHAVEFFQVLGDTQYMKHIRAHNKYAPDVRSWKTRAFADTGFDKASHKVDVHSMASVGLPRYNIQNIGIFLWSLNAYSMTQATPALAAPTAGAVCYRLHPLGLDAPLFHRAVPQGEQIEEPAEVSNVPDRLTRPALCADLQRGVGSQFYGEGSSLALYLDSLVLSPYQLCVADLSGDDGSWSNVGQAGADVEAMIDPELGRVVVLAKDAGGDTPTLKASYFCGFNADMGGGEYEREDTFTVTDPAKIFPFPDTTRYPDLQAALTFVAGQLTTDSAAALEFSATDVYTPAASGALTVDIPAGCTLELRAADNTRPTLLLRGELIITGDKNSTLLLNGLLLAAAPDMISPASPALLHVPAARGAGDNLLAELHLQHCTLMPGWAADGQGTPLFPDAPSIKAESTKLEIEAERCILGAILADEIIEVQLTDSIIDATGPANVAYAAGDGTSAGGPLTMVGCTAIGKVHAEELSLVSNSILWAVASDGWASGLIAARVQEGCVRFSYLPYKAVTPPRYQCVERALAGPQPVFNSFRYGDPAYLKLLAGTEDVIRRGSDDAAEMGAFHFVLAPQREADLNIRLQEYLPVGLTAGLVYQT